MKKSRRELSGKYSVIRLRKHESTYWVKSNPMCLQCARTDLYLPKVVFRKVSMKLARVLL